MLRNHIKFAVRIFWKDRTYSLLNVLGLTLGITVGIILLLYLQNELNYDKHHEKSDQIYRLTHHLKAQGADFNTSRTARELAPILKEEIPEVINYIRFRQLGNIMITTKLDSNEPIKFYERHIVETDTSFLTFFSHDVIEGDPKHCLEGPGKVVLTESIAKKYFGNESAIGQVILLGEENKRTVSAVISDLPDNSHLKYTMLMSEVRERQWIQESRENPMKYSEGFWNPGVYTYLLMPKGYDTSLFDSKFAGIFEKYFRPFADRIEGTATPLLQPFTSIHFESDLANDEPNGNIYYVYTFSTIGFFLILLACINYMNLATARSVYRSGEIGIRKVLGVTRFSLFWSMLLEALVLSFIAMILSIIVCYIILSFTPFNFWIDKELTLDFINNTTLLFGVIGITLVVGVISGIYPALYIPSVPVVTALKGSFSGQGKGILLRKVLIVIQFVVSIFVIITTVLMDKQIEYMKKVDLGFDMENVLLVNIRNDELENKMDAVKSELLSNPNIISAATASTVPGLGIGGQVFMVEGKDEMIQKSMFSIFAGSDYLKTTGFEILQGRDFMKGKADLGKSLLVNEAGAKELGWGDSAINKKVRFFHGKDDFKVIGVVKDFNFESLHKKIAPLFILPSEVQWGTLHIRVNSTDLEKTIDYVESVITQFDSKYPFEYMFLDTEFNKQYRADQIQHQLISTLSYICIFISLLGLIGLSAFTVSQKAKEISIRKTLGGSVTHVLTIFSQGYVKLMIIATIIAIPVADYVIVDWLSAFAYQMPHEWLYYVIPSLIVLLFGLLTVLIQVAKAAKANPIDGLRSE